MFRCDFVVTESLETFTLFVVLVLVLEWCERKILLAGRWLEAGAGTVYEENTVG